MACVVVMCGRPHVSTWFSLPNQIIEFLGNGEAQRKSTWNAHKTGDKAGTPIISCAEMIDAKNDAGKTAWEVRTAQKDGCDFSDGTYPTRDSLVRMM